MTLDELVTLVESIYNQEGHSLPVVVRDEDGCYQTITGILISTLANGTKVIKIVS